MLDSAGAVIATLGVFSPDLLSEGPVSRRVPLASGRNWRLAAAKHQYGACVYLTLGRSEPECASSLWRYDAVDATVGCTPRLAVLTGSLDRGTRSVRAVLRGGRTLRARVVRACRDRGIPVRTLPTVFELLQTGANVMRQVRELRVEDILGREPVRIELERVGAYLTGQVVMVTGAGGSIGAELCRQIARVGPRRLVVLDHAEDNLFSIMRELEEDRHVRSAIPVLADCREEERMREVFAEHRPTAVFHAAAYKHVGLMEVNPVEAVRNNALATRITAHVAGEYGVGTFVLVSTDKAVSPATVMGASKALAEWAVEAAGAHHPDTRYASVRFGNVLGSSGSVVTIFRRQIAAGGPVTVTDRRMTRYFMTIPEAVQLIIRSGSLGQGGEVFVLEMGEPVAIMDLARDMIRLSGLEPDRDIAIEVVGRRPGEKLHEELFNPFERPQPTAAEKILLAEREPLDPRWVEETFDQVNVLVLEGDAAGLAAKVAELSTARSGTALGTSS